MSGRSITEADFKRGIIDLLEQQNDVFELMLQGLGSKQIELLIALAEEPSSSLFSSEFSSRHNLGSASTIQGAYKKLVNLDYIEKAEGIWRLTDPIFVEWLKRR